MCTPTAAIGVVMAGASFLQQREQAEAANEAAEIQYETEMERAKAESMNRENQLSQEVLEESQRLNQQRQELALEALREQAGKRVASAESGTGGVSKIRSFLSTDIQEGVAESDLDTQAKNTAFSVAQRSRGIHTALASRQENAFLTRQANRRRKPGVVDLGIGLLGAPGVATGIGDKASKAFSSTPQTTFQPGQGVTGARRI
jgi:hypothetical protein